MKNTVNITCYYKNNEKISIFFLILYQVEDRYLCTLFNAHYFIKFAWVCDVLKLNLRVKLHIIIVIITNNFACF